MKLFYVVLLAVVQQKTVSDKLFSNQDVAQLTKVKLVFSELVESASYIKEELTTKINEESSSYLLEGLNNGMALLNSGASGTLKYNSFSDLLNMCRYAANYVKNVVDTKFNEILDKVDLIDMDADDFITQFRTKIIQPLNKLLQKLRIDSVLAPANVKICVKAYLSLVPLFENSDTILNQLHLGIDIEMVSFGHLKQTRITEINDRAFPHIFKGWMIVRKLVDSDPSVERYSKLLSKCTDAADATINEAKLFFDEVFERSYLIGVEILTENNKELFTGDLDNISDNTKALLAYYGQKFNSKIMPDIEQGFKLLKHKKISVPLEMKKCVDKVITAMWSSRWSPFSYFRNFVLNNEKRCCKYSF